MDPPPPPPVKVVLDGEPKPNGNHALAIKNQHHLLRPTSPQVDVLYRECLRNHAASLGGHALDGCGEFMPSPASDPAFPTSLRCAACGCHRNFHRRLPHPLQPSKGSHDHDRGHEMDAARHGNDEEDEDDDEDDEDDSDEDDDEEEEQEHGEEGLINARRSSPLPQPPLTLYASAPHMLMALSAGLPGGSPVPVSAAAPLHPAARPIAPAAAVAASDPPASAMAAAVQPRKRFRSKFSPEQKERMQKLSERLGWRMLKRDEGLVEETCREIGVDKGVFKVWMHNNKHNYLAYSRKANAGGGSSVEGDGSIAFERVGNGGGSNGHLMNVSSSSS